MHWFAYIGPDPPSPGNPMGLLNQKQHDLINTLLTALFVVFFVFL